MRAFLFSSSCLVFVALVGCGSSDAPTDAEDSSIDDGAVVDSGAHDSATVDSSHDTTTADSSHDGAADAADAPGTDATDSFAPDSVVDDAPDSIAPDSIAPDSIDVDSVVLDAGAPDGDGGKSCTTNADCASNELCDAPTCTGPGTCTTKPFIGVFCKMDPDSSCGCNGTDYTSACAAHKAGVRVAHYGACAETGCNSTADCASLGAGYFCSFGVGYCSIEGFCKAEGSPCPLFLAPYCTCAGVDVSTNTCLADESGTRLYHSGACP